MRAFGGILAAALLAAALSAGAFGYQKHHTAADQAAAKAAVLRKSDLPAGISWKSVPPSPSDDSNLHCKGYAPKQSDLVETGTAEADYTAPGLFVTSDAQLFATAGMVRTDLRRSLVPALTACLGQALQRSAKNGLQVLSSTRVPILAVGADRSAAFRVRYRRTANGTTFEGAMDIILLARGRTEVTVLVDANLGSAANVKQSETDLSLFEARLSAVALARTRGTHPAPPTA